ncbi:MAG: hypothetical protein V5A64_04080 [Candidatus Thermoplasmatota archaeon]
MAVAIKESTLNTSEEDFDFEDFWDLLINITKFLADFTGSIADFFNSIVEMISSFIVKFFENNPDVLIWGTVFYIILVFFSKVLELFVDIVDLQIWDDIQNLFNSSGDKDEEKTSAHQLERYPYFSIDLDI